MILACIVVHITPVPGDGLVPSAGKWVVPVSSGQTGLGNLSGPDNISSNWCSFSCTTEALLCSGGEIIVLRVGGELDLCTLATLQSTLDDCLNQRPAHLVVDLARMTFCSVRGLTLLTQADRIAAAKATRYAVSAVPSRIDRIWTLMWNGDLPVRYRSIATALTAIRAAG